MKQESATNNEEIYSRMRSPVIYSPSEVNESNVHEIGF